MVNNFNVNRINYTEAMWKIIRSKNLAAAKAHYDACQSRSGKAMWWNVIEQIWRNNAKTTKLSQTWHVDRIHKVVMPRVDGCDSGNYVYWVRFYDEAGNYHFDKFGTAEDIIRRWGTIFENEAFIKQYNIVSYRVMGVWDCGNHPFVNAQLEGYLKEHACLAYGMEHYVPNDRFNCRLSPKLVNQWVADFFAMRGM